MVFQQLYMYMLQQNLLYHLYSSIFESTPDSGKICTQNATVLLLIVRIKFSKLF